MAGTPASWPLRATAGHVKRVFLHPGEVHFDDGEAQLHTVLGSCVAITLWHPGRRIGGMCHYVLPVRVGTRLGPLDGRYADEAMEMLVAAAQARDTAIGEYQAKIFGGADVLALTSSTNETVGERNVAAALRLLDHHRVPLLVAHVGESGHRRIFLDVASGDVWVRHQLGSGERPPTINGRM
ncbi:MAG: chemotaxis protein CheD [Ectothiorhodospiraceae bacterium]|nr:chemotaxis protein CheD [Ectothiorhodospiraceae bacterium]